MASDVMIGKKLVGDRHPCFVTFELGPTHEGLDSAKRLVKCAADAGADAVKVQILDPDRLVADKKQLFSYSVLTDRETGATETVEEPLYDILLRRYLNDDDWADVKKYADDLGMSFFSTVGFEEDIELVERMGCHSIKLASADVNHFPLIRRAAKSGLCIQLDTGMSTLGEIEEAIDIIRCEGNENIIIHQCPSGYPARLSSINLRMIQTIKSMFPFPVGFSDHSPGNDMDVAAVAMGVNLVEKTITEDRMIRSVEHVMSIEPAEMVDFVQSIKAVEVALGTGRRVINSAEKEKRSLIRRSVFLKSSAASGQRLVDCDVEFKRPGLGLSPKAYEKSLNAKLKRNVGAGEMINISDLDYGDH